MTKVEPGSEVSPIRTNRARGAMLSCGFSIVVALASWGLINAIHPIFSVAPEYEIGMGAPNEARMALLAQQARVDRMNAAVVFAMGGSLLFAALSIFASGCCALSIRIVISLVWGGIWGALSGYVGTILFAAVMPSDSLPNATNTGIAQAVVFAVFGVGAGLLYGGFSKNPTKIGKAVIIGTVAGAAGGVLFPIVAGLVMPSQGISGLVQANNAGILWLVIPFAAIGYALSSISDQ